eukprot:598794-Rhodomonas_salina.2
MLNEFKVACVPGRVSCLVLAVRRGVEADMGGGAQANERAIKDELAHVLNEREGLQVPTPLSLSLARARFLQHPRSDCDSGSRSWHAPSRLCVCLRAWWRGPD